MKAGKDYIGVGIGALVLNDKGQILLMQRGPKSKNEIGNWTQPGGTVEFGEKLQDAVIREIKEETDLDVAVLMLTSVSDHMIPQEGQHWVSMSYLVKVISGIPQIMEPGKTADMRWFDLDKLPSPISIPTLDNIKAYEEMLGNDKFNS